MSDNQFENLCGVIVLIAVMIFFYKMNRDD